MGDVSDGFSAEAIHHNIFGIPSSAVDSGAPLSPAEVSRLKDMVAPVATEWRYTLDGDQTRRLLEGQGASSMDEKWLVVSDSTHAATTRMVRFYRSWTGRQQFAIELRLNGIGSEIHKAWWESDASHLKNPSEAFHRETFEGVCEYVLRIARPKPVDDR